MIVLLIALPLAGSALVALLHRRHAALGVVAVSTAAATLVLAVLLAARGASAIPLPWGAGLAPRLALAGFGRVMAVLVPAVAAPVLAYAAADRAERAPARLLALMLAFVGAMELLVLADDLLSLLIGWELVGALSWALIAHRWQDSGAPRAAGWAFLTTRFGDLGLYLAAAAAYGSTGSVAYQALPQAGGAALHVIAAGVLVAAAAKSAQLPFSPWLFSAMAGPTPVSALLHSATMVAAGAYLLVRLGPALAGAGWFAPAVAGVGLATALAGGVVAPLQTDFKRALAGSTSSQYGLMFLAAGAGSTAAAGAHLVVHAAFKALLFLGAGVAIHATGSGDLGRMRLGRALPRTAALFAVGALALAAVPPLAGAWSKEEVVAAAFSAGSWLGMGALLAGALGAFYAVRLFLLAYAPGEARPVQPPRRTETAAMAVLAAYSLLLGVLWLPQARAMVEGVSGGKLAEGAWWTFAASGAALLAGGAPAWRLRRDGRLATLGLPVRARAGAAAWFGLPALARAAVLQPTLALSRGLARVDDVVVDAGVRAAAGAARWVSRRFSGWGEWGIDGTVHALARAALAAARGSGAVDDGGVDAAVETVARGVGSGGDWSRRLQTGMAHHYYVMVAVGVAGAVALAMFWR